MKIIPIFGATIVLCMTVAASASVDGFVFENPVALGTGCPGNRSAEIIGVNTSTLSIAFKEYDAGKDATSGIARSACSFAIPMNISRGFQMSRIIVDWNIYVKGRGELKRKLFIAGGLWNNNWRSSVFNKPNGENITVRDDLIHDSLATDCNGGRFNMRINSQVRVKDERSYISVSPNDGHSRVTFRVELKKC